MERFATEVVNLAQQTIHGLWKNANDRTIAKDIPTLSGSYYRAVGLSKGTVFPFFVLSRNYREQTGDFELLIGGAVPREGLAHLTLAAGDYVRMVVHPKLGFLWGPAIGEAKRWFYTQWLPKSRYAVCNLEYEYHTEASAGKHPVVELYFAVEEKETGAQKVAGPIEEGEESGWIY